jgi:hypothetical protein
MSAGLGAAVAAIGLLLCILFSHLALRVARSRLRANRLSRSDPTVASLTLSAAAAACFFATSAWDLGLGLGTRGIYIATGHAWVLSMFAFFAWLLDVLDCEAGLTLSHTRDRPRLVVFLTVTCITNYIVGAACVIAALVTSQRRFTVWGNFFFIAIGLAVAYRFAAATQHIIVELQRHREATARLGGHVSVDVDRVTLKLRALQFCFSFVVLGLSVLGARQFAVHWNTREPLRADPFLAYAWRGIVLVALVARLAFALRVTEATAPAPQVHTPAQVTAPAHSPASRTPQAQLANASLTDATLHFKSVTVQ